MALTLGSGPFGHHPAGQFNGSFEGPKHLLYFDEYPRRMRAVLGGETVIDSVRGRLLYESSLPPMLYVPSEDVRQDLLEPTDHSTHCPFKGDASYWTIRAGSKIAENALWGYPEPIESASWLLGYVAPYWDKMDAWYVEEDEIPGHLRDPYHRVDVNDARARVTVRANGELIAESERPKLLFETSLPPRAYIPREDVREELLTPSDSTTHCPYKGTASYWSLRTEGGQTIEDAVWTYTEPLKESAAVAGYVSFFGDGIEMEIDRSGTRDEALAA